jgi:hypothetical protein
MARQKAKVTCNVRWNWGLGAHMKGRSVRPTPAISPEELASYSIQMGCASADQYITGLAFSLTTSQQKALLQEDIFFHHFSAIAAVFNTIRDVNFRRSFLDKLTDAIDSETYLSPKKDLGYAPLVNFSLKDRKEVVKDGFISFSGIKACQRQELYLKRKPSESEMSVMDLEISRKIAEWDSPSLGPVQYLSVAFLSRLITSMGIDLRNQFPLFIDLSFYAVAESKAAIELYIGVLEEGM